MRSLLQQPMQQQTRIVRQQQQQRQQEQQFFITGDGLLDADATTVTLRRTTTIPSSSYRSKSRIRRRAKRKKVAAATATALLFLLMMMTMRSFLGSRAGPPILRAQAFLLLPTMRRSSDDSRLLFQSRPRRRSSIITTTTQVVGPRFLATAAAAATSESSTAATKTDGNKSSSSSIKKYLVIVESPAKCATIEKILNKNNEKGGNNNNNDKQYQVVSCMGHIRNLPKGASSSKKKNNSKKASKSKTSKSKTSTKSSASVVSTTKFPYQIAGVDLEGGQYRPEYVVMDEKLKVVRDLQRAVANVDAVLLATDPDREGEAMAWHLAQVLELEPAATYFSETTTSIGKKTKTKPYQRIRFTEITPQAIREAVREGTAGDNHNADDSINGDDDASSSALIHANLVTAQETRRVLDRLAGFTVSPVLWKKIAPGLSAGRVQSVGLQLIVQRERQRLAFEATPYFDATAIVSAILQMPLPRSPQQQQPYLLPPKSSYNMTARLVSINGTAVANTGKDFTSQGRTLTEQSQHKIHLRTEADAQYWIDRLLLDDDDGDVPATWRVHSIQSRRRTTRPPRPYKTSTLQQEAVRKLGLSVQVTMRAAQQLYEAGCISYMRTDSTVLSRDAERTVEAAVSNAFGRHMLVEKEAADKHSKKERKTTDQEAHEAIRPAIQSDGAFLTPGALPPAVAGSSAALQVYRMIYQRTLAHRMPPLVTNQTQVVISGSRPCGEDGAELLELHFRVSGSVVVSPGYTLAYGDDSAINGDDDNSQRLPPLQEGQVLQLHELFPVGHETQPPPRYTEASFVKELEALGVGRPSTYAKIVQILRDRAYVGSPVRADGDSRSFGGNRRGSKTPSGPAISAVRAAGGVEFTGGGGAARGPLVPSLSAFVVCALLEKYCPTYVDPNFTAQMEDRLDQIASGGSGDASLSVEDERVAYLDEFYAGEEGLAAQIKRIEDTVKASDARRAVLPALMTLSDRNDVVSSSSEKEEEEEIGLFIGPWGPYVQQIGWTKDEDSSPSPSEKPPTAQLPPSMAADISTIKPNLLKALLETKQEGGIVLGEHPKDGRNIRLKTGRYGAYLQWGDDGVEGTTTHSLPRSKAVLKEVDDVSAAIDNDDDDKIDSKSATNNLIGISLEEAIGYVGLPRTVSTVNDMPIVAAIGPYGPYLKYDKQFTSLNKNDGDVLTIGAKDAERLVTERIINKSSKLGRGVLVDLGEKDGSKVTVKTGRFGVYLNWKGVNAKLPADYEDSPESIPLEEAWLLIQEKAASDPKGGKVSKTKKSSSSPDLPPAPKRPLSSYLHFCAAKRAEVAESTKTLGEVSKKLAALWAEIGPKERKKYEELAAAGKLEYEKKRKAWKSECDKLKKAKQGRKASKAKTVRKNDENKPKRPKSAYLYFCAAKRSQVAETVKSLGDISKELARQWAETTDRTEYDLLAEADKKRYEEEMNKYSDGDRGGAQKFGHAVNGSSSTTSKKSSSKTQKAPSAYMLFCREFRPTIVDDNGKKLPLGETTKRLAALWRECDEETKSKFKARAMEEKEKVLAAA